jgi:ParB-like chromosome segregation protein Spo0J
MPRDTRQLELDIPRFTASRLQRISTSKIIGSQYFPHDEDMTRSIEAGGLLEPIKVEREGENFRILDGRRRVKAFKTLAIPDIPAMVYGTLSATARAAITLTTNLQRHGNIAAELDAYMQLSGGEDMSLPEISALLRIPVGKLRIYHRLADLEPSAQTALRAGRIGATVGSAMVRHLDQSEQQEVVRSTGNQVITMANLAPYLPESAQNEEDEEAQIRIPLPSTAVTNPDGVTLQKTTDETGAVHWFINGQEYIPITQATVVVEEVSVANMTLRDTWDGSLRLLEAAYAGMPVAPDDDSEQYYLQLRAAIDAAREIARRRSGRYAVPT